MAFKNCVPQKSQASWHEYWRHLRVGDDLTGCYSDGLLPILTKYLDQGKKILEAGCGLGKWVIYLSRKGYQIEGLDSYRKGIEAIKRYDPKLRVRVGDVERLPLRSESVDFYLSFGVIEHWEEGPRKPLSEAFRVLKKGGVAIVETPYDNPLRQLTRALSILVQMIKWPARIVSESFGLRVKREQVKTVFYEYRFTAEELKSYLSGAGFKILGVFPKDDISPERSIGLWLDFPGLRRMGRQDFYLNDLGAKIKSLLCPFPWLWSACVVVVAQKI